METKHHTFRRFLLIALLAGCLFICLYGGGARSLFAQEPDDNGGVSDKRIAAVITCKGMIDNGLFESIKRRSDEAITAGASYIILEVGTYGGLVKSADDIYKLFMQDLNKKVTSVAFVDTEAISAGALSSVACNDIIMRPTTKIGDCAPITMGGQLEGVEREKSESFIRASFRSAAEANNYPPALLEAMVTQAVEVHRVKNNKTGEYEFFKKEDMPKDDDGYDIEGAELEVIEELSNTRKLCFIKQMVIEYHHHIVGESDVFSKMLKLLEDAGFGYQIESQLCKPLIREQFQDILVYAYRKGSTT